MHFSALILAVSLASAQYAHQQFGPSPEELDHLKHLQGSHNENQQAQNEGQNYDPNGNLNLNYDGNNEKNNGNLDYQNAAPAPVHAQSSPAPMTHSTFIIRPSQAPIASPHAQTPAQGYASNYPTPSTPSAAVAHSNAAAPAPQLSKQQRPDSQTRTHQAAAPANPPAAPQSQDIPVGASGGIALIDPMRPGSQVAPVSWGKQQFGKDEGNTFCVGQCFADERDAQCGKPYALPVYKSAKGCYMCCFTSDF